MVSSRASAVRVALAIMVSLFLVALVVVAAPSVRPADAAVGVASVVTTKKAVSAVPRPSIKRDYIPFGRKRVKQMKRYAKRHYGIRSAKLTDPKQIMLHFSVSSTYKSIWNYFAGNQPSLGERPGSCTPFIVDKDGTIYQLTNLKRMCRHVIGLNHVSIGIEFVEERSASRILARPRQVAAGHALVAWLQSKFGIPATDVIGHGTANKSRFFRDDRGWKNDHTDWQPKQLRRFRAGL